jgi:hypothetical protein
MPLADLIRQQDRRFCKARLGGAKLRKEYGKLPTLGGSIRRDFVRSFGHPFDLSSIAP